MPILGEAHAAAGRDGLAGAVRLEFHGGHLFSLWVPEAECETGDLRIDAVFRGRISLHERLVVRHDVRKPTGVGIKSELREAGGPADFKEVPAHLHVWVRGPQDNRVIRPLVIHYEAVRE